MAGTVRYLTLTSIETFWAQFTNCAEHNKWNRAQYTD